MSRNAAKLKPYARGRDNEMPLKGLLAKQQKLYLYLRTLFPALPESNVESFPKTALLIRKNVIEKSRHLSKYIFFRFF